MLLVSTPTLRIRPWALAARGQSAAPPIREMNSRRLIACHGCAAPSSERAAEISQRHVLDVGKLPLDRVVVDDPVPELRIAGNDRGGAARRDGRQITVLLRRLDVAFGALGPDRLA